MRLASTLFLLPFAVSVVVYYFLAESACIGFTCDIGVRRPPRDGFGWGRGKLGRWVRLPARAKRMPWEKDADFCVHPDDAERARGEDQGGGCCFQLKCTRTCAISERLKWISSFVVELQVVPNGTWLTPRDNRRTTYCGFNASMCPFAEQPLKTW